MGLLAYRRGLLLYQLNRYKTPWLVAGHYPVDATILDAFRNQWQFVTILRNPVERWFSHFFYSQYRKHPEVSLGEYMHSEHGERMGAIYVRHLLTQERDETRVGPENIDAAIHVLSCFDVVGVMDRMDRFSTTFASHFGRPLRIGHENASPIARNERAIQVTPEIRARVSAICAPDLRVYEHARQMAGVNRSNLV